MKYKLIVMVSLLLLASCYVPSSRVYDLRAKNDDAIWLNGKELIKLSENNIEVIVNFDQVEHGIASFDLSIANYTDQAVLIIPEDFYCSVTHRLDEEKIIYAINPEEMILNCNKQIEKNYAQNQSEGRTELLFSLFDLAEDIHNNDKTDEEIDEQRADREDREVRYDKNKEKYIANLNQLYNKRDFWQNEALRKTTLFPGHKLNGKVFFKIPTSSLMLQLFLPIEDRNLMLEYEKIK